MINRMPLIVQRACDSGRIALDRAHFSKKSKRNSTEGTYVYLYLGLVLAEIGRTTFVPPEGLTGGGDSTISLVVRPYGAACGCAARHGRGRQNGLSQLYQGGVFFLPYYFTVWDCILSRAHASFVHVKRLRTIPKKCEKGYRSPRNNIIAC